ncbi:MAG: CoB--CoM heterodisulfide reductase subunit B [Promethearchaeota archaeon]
MRKTTEEYAVYLGCTIPIKNPSFELSFRMICEKLGIQLHEMEGASCCPDPVATLSLNFQTWLALAARNLTIAEEMGKDIVTLCSGCYETLKTAREILLENEKFRERVNGVLKELGREFKGTSDVFHFVEILTRPDILEKIKGMVVHPLKEMKIGAHYGCHMVRPSKFLDADDPERPEKLDKLIEAIGGEAVDWSEKMLCCGYCAKLQPEIGVKLVGEKIESLQVQVGADCLTVACPACSSQYDVQQRKAAKEMDVKLETPVIFFTELVALAIGIPPEKLDLKRRSIKPTKFLQKFESVTGGGESS